MKSPGVAKYTAPVVCLMPKLSESRLEVCLEKFGRSQATKVLDEPGLVLHKAFDLAQDLQINHDLAGAFLVHPMARVKPVMQLAMGAPPTSSDLPRSATSLLKKSSTSALAICRFALICSTAPSAGRCQSSTREGGAGTEP